MPLSSGARLGSYEVLSPLGAGGMGEVYRARDTKLHRDVAVKVLPDHLVNDRERLSRFEREAQLLASLNHPNIAAVYGLEDSTGVPALVLELVEGPTLAERVAAGPLPLDEALTIAAQIASALEAAHEHGVIHRDLKPSNVKVRADGTVKVLDFGLAKLTDRGDAAASASPLSMSPTITSPALTQAGVILGTAAYMSPEQARGKAADSRSDIWAFGCVLYEMLTGRRAFEGGDSISDVIAEILKNEPDWQRLSADVPARVRTLLRRCLRKDPKKRLPHIALVRIELEETPGDGETANVAVRQRPSKAALAIAGAAILAGVLVGSVMWALRPSVQTPRVLRFPVNLPEGLFVDPTLRSVAVSRDGARVAFVASGRIFVRNLAEAEAKPVPGSEVPQGFLGEPVFSPAGDQIAYWSGTSADTATLKRIGINGGSPVTIARAGFPFGTTWSERGIVFGQALDVKRKGVLRVAAEGGTPEVLVTPADGESPSSPQILPGGDAVLFTAFSDLRTPQDFTQARWDRAKVVAQRLSSGERKTIVDGGSDGRYLPTGHLTYMVGTTMFAVPFDADSLSVTGARVQVFDGAARTTFGTIVLGGTQLDVSGSGTAVYVPSSADAGAMTIALIDPQTGQTTPLSGVTPGEYAFPRVSPDGRKLAVVRERPEDANIWIYDLAGPTAFRQLTSGGRNLYPVWSADGQRIAFQSDRDGDLAIFWQPADGTGRAERLTKPEPGVIETPGSWSPDGKTLLFEVTTPATASRGATRTLWSFAIGERKAAKVAEIATSVVTMLTPAFSPDGRWFAYAATSAPTSADLKVYVQPFPPTGAPHPIGDGAHPFWSRDGKKLYFFPPPPNPLAVVNVDVTNGFTWGNPQPIKNARFRARGPGIQRENDILADGRFVGIVAANAERPTPTVPTVQVIVNWFEELRRLAPAK